MMKRLLLAIALVCAGAFSVSGQVSTLVPGSQSTPYTVATLPTGFLGRQAYVTDGSTATDCTVGGGSNKVPCIYNGSAYVYHAAGAGNVTGPGSSTDNAVARYDLTTGKLLQNSLMTVDDSGSPNIPTGQTYKINNVALAKGDVGLGNVDNTSDVNKPVSTAQAAADALNLKIASNLGDLNSASAARSNLGGTTVGIGFFTFTNPSAIQFPRVEADNSVTGRTAAQVLSDIAALPLAGGTLTGNLLFSTDNTLDIGASAATRPRDLFLGRNAAVGGTFSLTGQLAIGWGATTPTAGPMIAVASTVSTSPRGILSAQFSSDTAGARVGFQKARGTIASPATVVTGDTLGRLMFRGYDGTSYLEMGSIEIASNGTIGTNQVPTQMIFSTATNASPSVLTTALTIGNDQKATFAGAVIINTAGSSTGPVPALQLTNGTNSLSVYRDGGTGDWRIGNENGLGLALQIGGTPNATLGLGSASQLSWNSSTTANAQSPDLMLRRGAAANLQLGAATGSGAAVAQTLSVQGSSGASATPALFTIAGSDQSGTTTTGGGLKIRGGNGTSAGGAVEIWTSATTTPAVAATFAADKTVTLVNSLGLGAAPSRLLHLSGAFGVNPPYIRLQRTDGTTTYNGGLEFYSQNGTLGWAIEENVTIGSDVVEFNHAGSNFASLSTAGFSIGSGGTRITKHLSSTATLNFANLAAIGCEDLTITVTGAALGDTVGIGVPNASIVANGNFFGWVSATDTVSIRFCTVVSGDPPSGTFRADVWQH